MPGGTLEGSTSPPSTIAPHIKNHEEAGEVAKGKVEVEAEDVTLTQKPCLLRRLNPCEETSLHTIGSRLFKMPSLPQQGPLEDN